MNCTACGVKSQSTAFCTNCGHRLAGSRAPSAAARGRPGAGHAASPGVGAARPASLPVPPASTAPPQITRPREASTGSQAEIYLSLQRSEEVVVHAASRIFAAYVVSGQVTAANEAEVLAKSVRNAMRIAVYTDKLVQSDEEPSS